MENVGAVNHMHTDEAEKSFNKTETAAADPIRRLGTGTSNLSDSDKKALVLFIVELMARQPYMSMFRGLSPTTLAHVVENRQCAETVLRRLHSDHGLNITLADAQVLQHDIKGLIQEIRQDFAAEDIHLSDTDIGQHLPDYLRSHAHEVRSLVVAPESVAQTESLRHFLLNKPWQICESHHHEFITSDQPVFYHPTWLNLNSDTPLGTLCFVVSPTVLLKISATPETQRWGKAKVFKLNSYIAEHCDHQIISTPTNIETLNRLRLGAYRPWVFAGTN